MNDYAAEWRVTEWQEYKNDWQNDKCVIIWQIAQEGKLCGLLPHIKRRDWLIHSQKLKIHKIHYRQNTICIPLEWLWFTIKNNEIMLN